MQPPNQSKYRPVKAGMPIWNSWIWLKAPGSQPKMTWLRLASAQYSSVEMTVPVSYTHLTLPTTERV